MGFLYKEKRTCRMGYSPKRQVRFLLVRVNHGMMVQYEGHSIPLKNGKFFWPYTVKQAAYDIESYSLLLISSGAKDDQRMKYPSRPKRGLEGWAWQSTLPKPRFFYWQGQLYDPCQFTFIRTVSSL